jgi:hypothetical protein
VWLTDLADLSALIRVPHLLRRAPVKQGSFAPAGLCCPDHRHYYDPLRLPLDCRPLHGATAYKPTRSYPPQGQGQVGPPQFPGQPSNRSTPSHAGRFLRTRSRLPGAFHGLRPVRAGSAPPWPTSQWENNYDASDFAHAADRPVDPPRFAPRLSATHGGFPTGDPGISPDRTHTGWLPLTYRSVTSQ